MNSIWRATHNKHYVEDSIWRAAHNITLCEWWLATKLYMEGSYNKLYMGSSL